MLSTLSRLKNHLGIAGTATDVTLSQILESADGAVKQFLGHNPEEQSYTEFYDGNGQRDLLLRQYPASAVASVWVDDSGYYGDGPDAFTASKLQAAGTDYALVRDNGARAESGLLRRLPFGRNWWGWTSGQVLTPYGRPIWPMGAGNVKVTYTAGWSAATLPANIRLATDQLAALVYRTRTFGGLLPGAERLGEYGYSLLSGQQAGELENVLGGIRSLLSSYVHRSF